MNQSSQINNYKGNLQKKKNCDYGVIVPTSFYTHPPKGDRDSNYRDKINVISESRTESPMAKSPRT